MFFLLFSSLPYKFAYPLSTSDWFNKHEVMAISSEMKIKSAREVPTTAPIDHPGSSEITGILLRKRAGKNSVLGFSHLFSRLYCHVLAISMAMSCKRDLEADSAGHLWVPVTLVESDPNAQ